MNEGDKITVYNRPAHVKRVFDGWVLVQWDDNNTEGHIPERHL